ncbi:MAG: hypothetical protein QOJ65_264 [Fimbriimonadaceae bacterium]|jgi:hypothetical protein|nr:hypothetical protein [Fimbriimonadaceae bacterium]
MRTNFVKPVAVLAAGFIATLAIVTVQKAYATTTVPNASRTTYNVAAGGASASFAVPSTAGPVFLMAQQTTENSRAIASMTLGYAFGTYGLLYWNGINSNQSTGGGGGGDSSLSSGWINSGNVGSNMLLVGFGASSTIQGMADGSNNPTRLRVAGNASSAVQVIVTMFW